MKVLKAALSSELLINRGAEDQQLALVAGQPAPRQEASVQLGLDSMLAPEFRQFIYRVFEINVSFMMLLFRTTSVATWAKLIAEGLLDLRTVKTMELKPSL